MSVGERERGREREGKAVRKKEGEGVRCMGEKGKEWGREKSQDPNGHHCLPLNIYSISFSLALFIQSTTGPEWPKGRQPCPDP